MPTESNAGLQVDKHFEGSPHSRSPDENVEDCWRLSEEFYRQKGWTPSDSLANRQIERIIRPGDPVAED